MSDIITNTTNTNESKVFNVYVSKSTTAGTALVTRGSLKKTDPKPTVVGLYVLEEIGIYPNLGNIDAQAGKLNFASFDGTTWKLIAVNLPINNTSVINGFASTSITEAGSAKNDKILYESIYRGVNVGAWTTITGITYTNGYYVDLSGVVTGGGTNNFYKISNLISVFPGEVYKANLRAGNLLAISGWNNGVYNSALAVVGTDTNNPADYNFTIPNGVNQIILTTRVEFTGQKLEKYGQTIGAVNRIDLLEDSVDIINKEIFKINYIATDTDFTGAKSITGNGTYFGGGKYYFNENIATEDFDFIAKLKVTTLGHFGLCRDDTAGYGTSVSINGNNVEVRKVNSTTGTIILTEALPFNIVENTSYVIRFYKQNKDVIFSIISETGDYFSKKFEYNDLTANFGRNWGKPSVFCMSGAIVIDKVYIRKSVYKQEKILVFGDSLIEGWGVISDLSKRYVALFQTLIGKENLFISGRGGESTTSIISRFNLELAKYAEVDYVLIALGTNDNTLSTYQNNINSLINSVKNARKIPIIVTITPRPGTYPLTSINYFVRNQSELYIDINKSINNGTETSWNSMYVNADSTHPNIAGNKKMFGRMMYDLCHIIDTSKINLIN